MRHGIVRLFKIALVVAVMSVAFTPSEATDPGPSTCPDVVSIALETLDQLCTETGRNEACYGHITLDAQPQPDVDRFNFDREGDIEDITDIQTLRLARMDVNDGTWGVAIMHIQADLPDTATDQNVTLLLFGDVEIDNAASATVQLEVQLASSANVNVRLRPNVQSPVVATAGRTDSVMATGRLADSSWVRIRLPDSGIAGWVASFLVEDGANIEALPVVGETSRHYGPMQAFMFQSGTNDVACPEQPHSGLIIQTPEGDAKVTFLINEVDIQLGSTVFFQADPGTEMTVSVVEGSAHVTAGGVSQDVVAGTKSSIPMDDDLTIAGPPGPPVPYDMADVQALPVGSLPRAIEIHPPVVLADDEDTSDQALAGDPTGDLTDDDSAVDGDSEDGDESEDDKEHPHGGPPGQTGDNPGQGGGGPPGQDLDRP